MKKPLLKYIVISLTIALLLSSIPRSSHGFTRIVDLVFNGASVDPDNLNEVLNEIKENKKKNKKISNPKKQKPTKLLIIHAKQKDPQNIKVEVDTSEVVVKNEGDIQAPISNPGFLDAVTEAVQLWDDVDIADVMFAPIKFASGQADPEDGKNVITFRAVEAPEGAAEGASYISIVTYARTNIVNFMNKLIMVKPGTILDADVIYDPTNNPCLALSSTIGDFQTGGDDVPTNEGGVDSNADISTCAAITGGDITEIAVQGVGAILGLDSSAIASAATSLVALIRERYSLTNDDEIGLANIYPNKDNLTNHGAISGKVLLNKKPVRGAHVVFEDTTTGEPVAGTITNILGRFEIRALPAGTYNVYAEPLDGPIRKNALIRNFFGFTSDLNFTTSVLPNPVTISANQRTKVIINVQEISASAFNINYLTAVLTEDDVNKTGGAFILPIRIMPGETLTDIQFWGSNISDSFGTLTVSGPGITVSNVMDASIPISPFFKCEECEDTADTMCARDPRCAPTEEITDEPDQIQGITADITCDATVLPGPRNIIFTGNQIDPEHPSFGLRDQITGGLTVYE